MDGKLVAAAIVAALLFFSFGCLAYGGPQPQPASGGEGDLPPLPPDGSQVAPPGAPLPGSDAPPPPPQ